jgi:hypothetical protein
MYFVVILHIFPHFGMLYQEKSGKPGLEKEEKKGGRTFVAVLASVAKECEVDKTFFGHDPPTPLNVRI